MVRPTKPKELKPKADVAPDQAKSGGGITDIKLIAVNTVITLLICGLFIVSNYFIVQNSLNTMFKQISNSGEGAEAEGGGEGDVIERGMIVDLGEFILNLSDPKIKRYLKINVAIELSRKETDPKPGESGGGGGHGGEGVDPMKAIAAEMDQYKPAIRDSVISTLSSKTAEELSSIAGKELAKEQIKEAVDAILAGDREVLRVSFGNFIIQ
ncbi:MAG: flagellar basal body-associated FliL family protein [Candidatus Gastranaerophilales bacterium]|nr:flagellar basal body-associated FliL family protein [Candidatus Gastranaerophilales bacterium]